MSRASRELCYAHWVIKEFEIKIMTGHFQTKPFFMLYQLWSELMIGLTAIENNKTFFDCVHFFPHFAERVYFMQIYVAIHSISLNYGVNIYTISVAAILAAPCHEKKKTFGLTGYIRTIFFYGVIRPVRTLWSFFLLLFHWSLLVGEGFCVYLKWSQRN